MGCWTVPCELDRLLWIITPHRKALYVNASSQRNSRQIRFYFRKPGIISTHPGFTVNELLNIEWRKCLSVSRTHSWTQSKFFNLSGKSGIELTIDPALLHFGSVSQCCWFDENLLLLPPPPPFFLKSAPLHCKDVERGGWRREAWWWYSGIACPFVRVSRLCPDRPWVVLNRSTFCKQCTAAAEVYHRLSGCRAQVFVFFTVKLTATCHKSYNQNM